MVILYHRPGSRWVFAFLQGLRLNVKSLPSKVDCVTCRAKAGQCVPKPLLVSGMSNLISCHKYFIWRGKKKTFQICPVQTQCRPFQHSSAVMGKQPCSPHGPILGGHGHPHGPPLHVWCEGKSPTRGFYWVVEGELWVPIAVCVQRAWTRNLFTKGWLQSRLKEQSLCPQSTVLWKTGLWFQVGTLVGFPSGECLLQASFSALWWGDIC